MASYVDNGNKLDWALPFQRTGNFPIDRSSMFSSYVDAVKYAAGNASNPDSRGLQGSSYVGQIITVYENDTVNVYKINADRTLSAIGEGSGGGSSYDVTITSVTTTSDGTIASFSTDSIPILQNQPAFITVNFPDGFGEIPIEPLLFYKEKFDFIEEQNTAVLDKLAYKSMPINILEEGTPADLPNLSLILTFDLTDENPYSSADLDISVSTPINTVVVDRIETESDVSMYHFSEDSRAILAAKPGFLNLNVKTSDGDHYKFFYQYATYVNDSSGSHRWLVYKSLPFPGYYIARDGEYIKTLTFDLDNENPYEYAIENDELYNNGSYNTTATINNFGNRIYFTDEAYYQIKKKRPEIVRVDVGTEVFYLVLSGTYDVNGNDTLVYATHTQTSIISVLISHDDTSSTGSNYTSSRIGYLDNLTTTDKRSIVHAINEVNAKPSGGTSDYSDLTNKPSINNVTLLGNKTSADLGLASQSSITDINSKIPNQASANNQLADKDFVNSSISTATATFRGTFTSINTLQATEGDKNDYAFYSHTDSAGNTVYDRYKYVGSPESVLPDGYTQVQSIKGNYINTHLVPKLNWHFILTFSSPRLQTVYDEPIFGIRETYTKFEIFKAGYTTETRVSIGSGTVYDSLTNNDVHVAEAKTNGAVYFDGVQKGVLSRGSAEPTVPLYLLAIDRPSQTPNIWTGQSSFYGLKIYDNEENLKMDLVPCVRDQDGSIGVYDLAGTINPDTNTPFYGGATSWTALSTDKWQYEYSLNNSSFTAEQWATINSGLTSQIATDVDNINDLIPSAAGLNNQLADKLYVDTAISTATATFRGTFTNLATLQATEGDRNDYAFYSHQDTAGNTLYDRYKYVGRPDSRVPEGYTEMLRVTKPQNAQVYVNTGYKIRSTDRIYAKCYGFEYAAKEASVFGATDSNNKRFRLRKGYMTGGASLQSSSGSVGVGSLYNNQMIVEAYDGKVYTSNMDGSNTQFKSNLTLEDVDANLYLFVENGDLVDDELNFYTQWISLGDFIVYDTEGNKKLELVPCQNNQGVNGFYDTVSGTFKEPTGGSLGAVAISSDNWLFEYSLNNTGFTSQQWTTINSGLAAHVTATGYDATKTQVLKNINGTLTWVDET